MSPVKGHRNGPTNHEQRRTEPFGSDGAFAREADGAKNSCGNSGDKCPACEAIVASLSVGGCDWAGIEAAWETEPPSTGCGDCAVDAGSTKGAYADFGPTLACEKLVEVE